MTFETHDATAYVHLDLLRELVEQVKGLRADVQRGRREKESSVASSSLSREDRGRLARLLPAIVGVLGSELFNSADVCAHDAAALRLVLVGLNSRQLGRLLRRAVDIPIAGYLVERVGLEAGAVLWRVLKVPEFSGNEKVLVPHAPLRGLP